MKKIDLKKAKTQIARPTTVREINTQIVLSHIRDLAPISRADIARATDLQRSSVSAIVEALGSAGLVEDIGTGDSTGGRKPNLLRIRRGTPVAVGVDVGAMSTSVVVADLAGNILEREKFRTFSNESETSDEIIRQISRFRSRHDNCFLEVGLSVPGVTNNAESSVAYVPHFGWKDWNVCERITDATGLTVTVDNDANAIALAELWFGREKNRKARNFVSVLVSDGIGTGIVIEGQVYRGENGDAGEFGHMTVGADAPTICSCGASSCWEAFASNTALQARFERASNKNGFSGKRPDVFALAMDGNKVARTVLRETAEYLGIGISNLIAGLGPQEVVVSGRITKAWDLVADDIHGAVEQSIRRKLPKTAIRPSSHSVQPTLIGAVALVLAGKFAAAN